MKINLHMLKEDLKHLNMQGHLTDAPWILKCSFPMACTSCPDSFRDDILYLLTPNLLPSTPPASGCPSILCIGIPPASWMQASCNLLYTENHLTLLELFNLVSESFARYQEWEAGLQNILDRRLPMRDLAVYSHSLIKNAIFVQGTSFRVFIHSVPDNAENTDLLQYYINNYVLKTNTVLPPEEINILISDTEYNRASEAIEPSFYSGSLYGFRTLFYNIRVDGVFVARICVDEVITPFTDRDFALIKILGHYLGKGISKEKFYSFNRFKDLDSILHSLLLHRLLPEKKIDLLLKHFHWNMNDSYVCLILKLRTRDDTSSALEPLAFSLGQMLSSECYTIYSGSIVFICNLTKLQMTDDQLLAFLLPNLRDNLLTASMSADYSDFKELYYYYSQAETAYLIGCSKHPTKWYFRFEDYQMDFLIHKVMKKTVPGALIPKGLKQLMAHDKKKNSGYTELLRTYLDHERNIADTIRAAYIHRNTFLYRIQKIQEILQMDLEDPDVRLTLQLAFRIMDTAKNSTSELND